ncbi:hypothetical protein G6F37_008897 [Rhizopus arrhizus]|nr:hypothetical protein G6F38_005827 [Rhizopus arrhizus]KAG1155043.1 hypothetical protein G6F37_008897 [Rhizopus arrhizus]
MLFNFLGHRDPIVQFGISFYPHCQNEDGQVICYPGSVFEGVVKITVTEPIPVQRIKLVFKANERVNYEAMGWERTETVNERLFAIRTILWGHPANIQAPLDTWPTLEVGEYNFPFACQMPVINYPPTFDHNLVAITFNMIVGVERAPYYDSIMSKPVHLQFQPIIETVLTQNLHEVTGSTRLTNHISAQISIPQLAFCIHEEPLSVPVIIRFISENNILAGISQLRVYIKRYYQIKYKTYIRKETSIIASHHIPKIAATGVNIQLKMPSRQKIEPTMTYSKHLTIEYRLVVTVKVRHGPLNGKKTLLEVPLIFGTLPFGARGPRQLEAYSHIVDNSSALNNRPSFLKLQPIAEEEFLPAYDSEEIPPAYRSNIPNNPNLSTSIQI